MPIAHIEFNAINLALDAIWRFADMPAAYYLDWLQVAGEEGKHFLLIDSWLAAARICLWGLSRPPRAVEHVRKTAEDITARMAFVPELYEARGLDATPQIQLKLQKIGSDDALEASKILDIILHEEVGHVAIGNHWYHWLC